MLRIFTLPLALLVSLSLIVACGPHDDDDHDEEIERIELVDRGATGTPVVATWTEADGWTGEGLPAINLQSTNQRISVGVRALDDHDDDLIQEDDDFFAQYAMATGATAGIVDMAVDAELFHCDHIHIYGEAVGTTEIVIEIWHGDHVELTTDPITITVIDEA
jgi:hypothetical protein